MVLLGWLLLTACSGGLNHSESEQVEAGSAIHLALDELEPMNVAFHLALAHGSLRAASTASLFLVRWLAKPASAVVFAASNHGVSTGRSRCVMSRKNSLASLAATDTSGEAR